MKINTEKTEIALKTASTEVSNFAVNAEAEVKALESKYATVVPIATTKEGYAHCKEVRRELMPIKADLEKARKLLKAPILAAGKLLDSTLNPLGERIETLYKPFENAYREVDTAIERKKQARLDAIANAFKQFDEAIISASGESSTVIQVLIDDMADFDLNPKVFAERTEEAATKHGEVMTKLTSLLQLATNQEEMEAKQAEMAEREAKIAEAEAKEQARIDKAEQDKKDIEFAEENKRQAEQRQKEMEQAREDARKGAEIKAKEQYEQQLAQAEQKAKDQAEAATRAERARIEAEQAKQDAEAKAREENRKHKAKIHNDILTHFLNTGITETQGKELIKLIANKAVNNIRINY